ncbi:MAG: (5-formylfuran-3-yl)methyl phosphate synthase [Gemmataceae bacterium]
MAGLIVSVRNAAEARVALAGGASLLDVKEPSRGSLGRAEGGVIASVLDAAAGVPVSAAMGELCDGEAGEPSLFRRLTFVKWGLAGAPSAWRDRLAALRAQVEGQGACRVVLAAYADYRRANAPSPAQVVHHAILDRFAAVLLDTCHKDGTTLLDWLSAHEVSDLAATCRAAGVRVALAGGLGRRQIELLAAAGPDWFAVRGAVCGQGNREGALEEGRVRALAGMFTRGP